MTNCEMMKRAKNVDCVCVCLTFGFDNIYFISYSHRENVQRHYFVSESKPNASQSIHLDCVKLLILRLQLFR